jgi:hypothetical protein
MILFQIRLSGTTDKLLLKETIYYEGFNELKDLSTEELIPKDKYSVGEYKILVIFNKYNAKTLERIFFSGYKKK